MKLRGILLELLEQSARFSAKAVADKIYNAKGYVSDDEQEAIDAVKSIKDINQLEQVEDKFVQLSEGRTISEYLISFLDNFKQNFKVLDHLYSLSKNNPIALESLVYPYAAELIYEYKRDIAREGSDIRKKQGQTNTIGLKDAGLLYDWFKPYLGEANFKKWVQIVQNPKYYDGLPGLNPYKPEEQFKYGKTKVVSSEAILIGQLMVGAIATLATAGLAAPAVAAWIGVGVPVGMGLYDAAQEYNLGNKETAGIMAAIEVLPIVSKIPGVKQAVKSVAKSLSKKLAGGVKYLTSQERFLANQLSKNKDAIAAELNKVKKTVQKTVLDKEVVDTIKQLYADKTINNWLKTLTPQEVSVIRTKILNGNYKYKDVKQLAQQGLKPTFKTTTAIKFTELEIKSINGLSNTIWKDINRNAAAGKTYILKNFKVADGTIKNIKIRVISLDQAKKLYPNTKSFSDAWADLPNNEIVFISEIIKSKSKQRFVTTMTHEAAHIKDPSFKSPKLNQTYDAYNDNLVPWSDINLSKKIEDSGKTWFKNYYLHPFEVNAITPQVTTQIVNATNRMLRNKGKQSTLKALTDLENWAKGLDTSWSFGSSEILGYYGKLTTPEIIAFLDAMAAKNPAGYTTLKTHIIKQTRYMIDQVNKYGLATEYITKLLKSLI